jgi:hypothetical protein
VVRLKLKNAAIGAVASGMTFNTPQQRKDFFSNNPISRAGGFVDVKEGEPARDSKGDLTFRYIAKSGEKRDVTVSADVFKDGPAGDAAVAKAAADLAKDYHRANASSR